MLTVGESLVIDLQGPLEGVGQGEESSPISTPLSSCCLGLRDAFACQEDSQPGFEEFNSFLDIRPDLVGEKRKK